ncbi:MAG TPA: redox-regulated ATPase YchF [Anaerolineae bacterium]|nr:redox-regulated ATPase YchF [Anaerolineae bacterium]HIQ06729.1 redox-regulated ATPase YchF [Anaerolineae bacterium]
MQIGIVGLPNAGKSTLFNALTRAGAVVASYPFTTIDPNVGVVAVPDPRLEQVAALIRPEKITPATVKFVDIAGLVKGASQGAGLGNQFLGHIRTVDAIAMVVRAFRDPDVPHVNPELDPLEDIETVDLELVLADLDTVNRRLEKIRSQAKGKPKEFAAQLEFLQRLCDHLDAGKRAEILERDDKERGWLDELNLLTAKPRLYVVNVGENDLPDGGDLAKAALAKAAAEGSEAVIICAACEAELSEWPEDEAQLYRQELGLSEPGLNQLIRAGYRLLRLITFFTITGGREARAWPIREGTTVWEAAGKIHTDMQRGFIRAEVISYADLLQAGALAHARERGLLRLEGRDYVVQDGDVIQIRFAV